MRCAFCFLETDEKTYTYVNAYFQTVRKGLSPYELDLTIQRQEIIQHLQKNGLSENDQAAMTTWIQENSSNFRCYLNSLKMLAWFLHFSNCYTGQDTLLGYDQFKTAVGLWNDRKLAVADTIFI